MELSEKQIKSLIKKIISEQQPQNQNNRSTNSGDVWAYNESKKLMAEIESLYKIFENSYIKGDGKFSAEKDAAMKRMNLLISQLYAKISAIKSNQITSKTKTIY